MILVKIALLTDTRVIEGLRFVPLALIAEQADVSREASLAAMYCTLGR